MHMKQRDKTIKWDTLLLCKSFFQVRQYFATYAFAKPCAGDRPLVCDVLLSQEVKDAEGENEFCWSQHKNCNKPSKPIVQVVSYSLIGEENELQLRSPMSL